MCELFADVEHPAVGLAGIEPRQIGRHGADRRRNRHVVVVEDDDQPRIPRAGVVHGFIGHAGRHGAVADHGDDVVVLAGEVARHRHAEAGGDRRRGMGGAERVVFAFGALGEAGQPAALPQGADAVASAGEDLVRVGLVADVPDQPVGRCVEDRVQRDGQFDHAQAGAEMAAGLGDGVDRLGAQFVGQLLELLQRQIFHVERQLDAVEQRGLGCLGQKQLREVYGRTRRQPQIMAGLHQFGTIRQFSGAGQRLVRGRFSRPDAAFRHLVTVATTSFGCPRPHNQSLAVACRPTNRRRAARCRSVYPTHRG